MSDKAKLVPHFITNSVVYIFTMYRKYKRKQTKT